jgi:predicted CoA-binding protein
MNRILVLGASPNPERFSFRAVLSLMQYNYEVVPVGFRNGTINGLQILTNKPQIENVHTILLYMGPQRQKEYYSYIINLQPARIIFNPGTENRELAILCEESGITIVNNCALVMLNSDTF